MHPNIYSISTCMGYLVTYLFTMKYVKTDVDWPSMGRVNIFGRKGQKKST